MEINKTKKTNVNKTNQGLFIVKRQIAMANQHLNALNMKSDEEYEENNNSGHNPAQFLKGNARREWERLSPRKKRRFTSTSSGTESTPKVNSIQIGHQQSNFKGSKVEPQSLGNNYIITSNHKNKGVRVERQRIEKSYVKSRIFNNEGIKIERQSLEKSYVKSNNLKIKDAKISWPGKNEGVKFEQQSLGRVYANARNLKVQSVKIEQQSLAKIYVKANNHRIKDSKVTRPSKSKGVKIEQQSLNKSYAKHYFKRKSKYTQTRLYIVNYEKARHVKQLNMKRSRNSLPNNSTKLKGNEITSVNYTQSKRNKDPATQTPAAKKTAYGSRAAPVSSTPPKTGAKVTTAGSKVASAGSKAAKTGVSATAGVASAGATAGATIVVSGAKKAADKFVESLQARAEARAESIKAMQTEAMSNIKGAKIDSTSSAVNLVGNVVVAVTAPIIVVGVQLVAAMTSALVVILIPVLILIAFIAIIAAILAMIFGGAETRTGGQAIVDVALQEYANSSQNIGGTKYKNWYGMNADWCAMFVSWCANECGYLDDDIMPRTAAVADSMAWYQNHNLWQSKESGYKPKAGDIIHFTNNMSHVGIVVDYDADTDRVTTVEGNSGLSGASVYHNGSQVTYNVYLSSASQISGYGTPEYPAGNTGATPLAEGESISIPDGLGSVHTYMGWSTITSTSSSQYKLRQDAGENYDSEGFAKIGDRYVIACTTTYGEVGDYVDFYQSDGTIIKCIIGDIKNQNDAGCNMWGHQNGQCIIEFVVDKSTWYGTGHSNPGTTLCHPEWNQTKTKAVNRGSYWGN